MTQPPLLDQIWQWIVNLGYEGEKPNDIGTGIKLLQTLQQNHPPTDKQLEYLDYLDYDGPPPNNQAEASHFIDALLKKTNLNDFDQDTDDKENGDKDDFDEEDEPPWTGFDTEPDIPGTRRFTFSVGKLKAIRRRIHRAMPDAETGYYSSRDGRSTCWYRFSGMWYRLFKTLKHLKIKDGFTLGAFVCRSGSGGRGVVFGIPINAEPEEIQIYENNIPKNSIKLRPHEIGGPVQCVLGDTWGTPILPKKGIAQYMTLFEMDNTPAAVMEAAMLGRELREFGAAWHGCYWSDIKIFGPKQVLGLHGKRMKLLEFLAQDNSDYGFFDPSPQNVSLNAHPTVIMRPDKRVFRHLSLCRLISSQLTLDRYIFSDKTADFKFESQTLAWGKGGFIY